MESIRFEHNLVLCFLLRVNTSNLEFRPVTCYYIFFLNFFLFINKSYKNQNLVLQLKLNSANMYYILNSIIFYVPEFSRFFLPFFDLYRSMAHLIIISFFFVHELFFELCFPQSAPDIIRMHQGHRNIS